MEIINKSTQYALKAIFCIYDAKDENLSLREIASKMNIPPSFLRKVLQKLGTANIVKASSGPIGGYKISGDLKSITLYEVHKIIQGEITLNRCFLSGEKSSDSTVVKCPMLKKFSKIQNDINDTLKSVSIAEIAQLYRNSCSCGHDGKNKRK